MFFATSLKSQFGGLRHPRVKSCRKIYVSWDEFKKKKPKGNTSFVVPIFRTKFGPRHSPVSTLKINMKLRLWL